MKNLEQLIGTDGHQLGAYRSVKPDNTKWIVVAQEAFGVNPHIRDVCDRFAALGFNAIAPALFDRAERGVEMDYSAASIEKYMKLRAQISENDVLTDLQAAADATGATKVGIVGYCFGGTATWWAATTTDRFAAASCWYGGGIAADKDRMPRCPVQMHFGATDGHIPLEQVDAVRSAQPKVDIHVYQGAGHGFGCDARPSFHQPSDDLALDRTIAFFNQHL